ncbi:MAG: hypothetical protein IT445_19555 [Phycisphaeraceae bacterium]|nr:hypothetical protein [Phycisphaeraceae bacterium]
MLLPSACTAPPLPEPGYLLRRDVDGERRLAAMQRMGDVCTYDDPRAYNDVLYKLLVSDSQPDAMRNVAIDRLIAYDSSSFQQWADEQVVYIDRWPVLEHLFDAAVQHHWDDFVPTAVLSYARPSREFDDKQRLERQAIEKLRPGQTVEQSIFEVFDAPDDTPCIRLAHRAAAWTLLCRLSDNPRSWIERSSSDSMLPLCLRQAGRTLDELPATSPSCSLLTLVMMGDASSWPMHGAARQPGLAMRHAPLFAAGKPVDSSHLAGELAATTHHVRLEEAERDEQWSETFAHWRNRLSGPDLQLIALIRLAMSERAVVDAWFDQADHDLADDSGEHGGALQWSPQSVCAIAYPSDPGAHDRQFVAPTSLLMEAVRGGLHYHFHAQAHRSARYAGPGRGDLAFVDRYQIAAVVLTFIDENTLNVDYYQPGGVVIDLGSITR